VTARGEIIAQIAAIVCYRDLGHPVRVAIDGVPAAGKSTLAAELAGAVAAAGRPAIHLSTDGYHHPRARRHQQGRLSALGYYEDAYDFAALVRYVLRPLGPGGDLRYRERIIDLAADEPDTESWREAPARAVLVVDGTFLQRPELLPYWDHRVFLHTSLPVARARGLARDEDLLGGRDPAAVAYEQRYHAAARHYLDTVHPAGHATMIMDNDDLAHPRLRIIRPAPRASG
jgi:uridine kinase